MNRIDSKIIMLNYIFVTSEDTVLIEKVYEILDACGTQMYSDLGLNHWIPAYPADAIKKDCEDKFVVLTWDTESKSYTSTFQMYLTEDRNLYIRKVATRPNLYGKGVGRKNLAFIADFAMKMGAAKICLDVYDKSENAISFYKKDGFVVTGKQKTRRFEVLLMEKVL